MKRLTALAALVLFAVPAFAAAPEVGQPAPDFTLKDLAGKDHKLSDYKGKVVVLEWVNYGCPFVRKHYESQNMQTLQKAVASHGGVWLSICSSAPGKQGNETPEEAGQKTKEYGATPTAYLKDEDGTVGKAYDAKATPEMYIIDKDGTLIYAGAIDDKPSPDAASLNGATNYVQEVLVALSEGKPVTPKQTKAYGCSVKY